MSDIRDEYLSRQADIVPSAISQLRVVVFGCGGIGSHAARVLASIGVERLILIDPDTVQMHNLGAGWFNGSYLGAPKVDAVAEQLFEWYPYTKAIPVQGTIEEVFSRLPNFDVGLAVTDDIESRKQAWDLTVEYINPPPGLWIDARMGGEGHTIITFRTDDEEAVERYNNGELTAEVNELPCGQKATGYITGGIIPYYIGATAHRYISGDILPYIYTGTATHPDFLVGTGVS